MGLLHAAELNGCYSSTNGSNRGGGGMPQGWDAVTGVASVALGVRARAAAGAICVGVQQEQQQHSRVPGCTLACTCTHPAPTAAWLLMP